MTIKIDAKKGYNIFWNSGNPDKPFEFSLPGPCRIVRESDWRRIMAVVRAADRHEAGSVKNASEIFNEALDDRLWILVDALRKHLEKRK